MTPPAPQNRTLTCSPREQATLAQRLLTVDGPVTWEAVRDRVIQQDCLAVAPLLPPACVDLLILDPPYNLAKNYHGHPFRPQSQAAYRSWFGAILAGFQPVLKPTASLYVCADWKTSSLIAPLLEQCFVVRNRITWEREKGRGARSNWKNNSEDIWFCTVSKTYTFNVEAVKLKRKVYAPYRQQDGQPKDWKTESQGKFRLTHPSNLWTDLSIPFWSMPENTDHPTQKPEKLVAKLILASSNPGDVVLDPFLGSGTTAVVAKKLDRSFVGIEQNLEYCCWALKRLARAETDRRIQGYQDGIFWDRNTLS